MIPVYYPAPQRIYYPGLHTESSEDISVAGAEAVEGVVKAHYVTAVEGVQRAISKPEAALRWLLSPDSARNLYSALPTYPLQREFLESLGDFGCEFVEDEFTGREPLLAGEQGGLRKIWLSKNLTPAFEYVPLTAPTPLTFETAALRLWATSSLRRFAKTDDELKRIWAIIKNRPA